MIQRVDVVDEKSAGAVRFTAKTLSFVVLFAAILISGYLSYLKIDTSIQAVCVKGGAFDCGTVLNSAYSEIADIPIAFLGLATNLIMLTILLLEYRLQFFQEYGPVLMFGVVLFAFMFSVYLVYVQASIIKAYCPWCLTHEALITIVFVLSIWRLRQWYIKTA